MTTTPPLRHPDTSNPDFMTRRAWWLIFANLLIPGLGPLLAGNRRFGRAGLRLWLLFWSAIVVLILLALLLRGSLLFVLTTGWGLTALSLLALAPGLWLLVTMFETLRQTNLIRVDPLARGLVAVIAIVLAVIPVFVGGWLSAQISVAKGAVVTLFGGPSAGLKAPTDGRINIMLLGGDRGADREGLRPDSISVMSLDVLSGRLVTVGLPRVLEGFGFAEGPMREKYPDTYDVCEVDVCYLNSVYTEVSVYDYDIYPDAEERGSEKGIEATRDAVEWITGLDIHYYALVDMQGFADLVDAMGGVEIDVKEPVAMGINDDGSPGWEPPTAYIQPGLQTLNGDHALWYARSRYETTDYARMERQRELQDAIIAQLPGKFPSHSAAIIAAMDKVVETDLPEGEAGIVADLFLKSRGREDNVRVEIAPPMFDPEYGIDYDLVRSTVKDAIAGEFVPPTQDAPDPGE